MRIASARDASSKRPSNPAAREARRAAGGALCEASRELARLRRVRGAYRTTWRRIARAEARLAFAAMLLAATLAEPADAGRPIFRETFLDHRIHLVPYGQESPALVDIDGDGDLDAFAGGNGIQFFENTGTAAAPAFAAPVFQAFGLTRGQQIPFAPAFADIDGDGDLDAFIGERYGNTNFFENMGTAEEPAFAEPVVNPFGLVDVGSFAAPALADLDGDGDLDALVGRGSGGTAFFRNTGTPGAPAFAPFVANAFNLRNLGYSNASPELVDLDGDGDLDAVIGSPFGGIFYFANAGTPTAPAFALRVFAPFGLAGSTTAFGDLDADGDQDVVFGGLLHENTGSASQPAFDPASPPVANPFGLYGREPSFGDLDGDGDLDVALGTHTGTLLLRNTGTASAPEFSDSWYLDSPRSSRNDAPALADIDGDGDLDLFVGGEFDCVYGCYAAGTLFFENTGSANEPDFATPALNSSGIPEIGPLASPELADVDGDGDLDLFLGNQDGRTTFVENTGTASAPAFTPRVGNPFGFPDTLIGIVSPELVDVDSDGDLDGFIGRATGNIGFTLDTGTATAPAFAPLQPNPFGLVNVGSNATPTFADIDGDGDLDAFAGGGPLGGFGQIFFFENVELGPGTCSDGIDNDFDGRADRAADPGCDSTADPDERSSRECDDGVDNDLDGRADWRAGGSGDPDCTSLSDGSELPLPVGGCGLGPELLALVPLVAAVRRLRARRWAPAR